MPLGNLTDCERELVRCTRDGEFFDFEDWVLREGLSDSDRDEARNVDGDVIATLLRGDLCLTGADPLRPHPRGLQAKGIALPGGLDVAEMSLIAPLWMVECEIARIDASSMRISGGFTLASCTITGSVDFIDARVDGTLTMAGTTLGQPSAPHGLRADGLTVKGDVFFGTTTNGRRFEADGQDAVRLLGATIGGDLVMQGARLGGQETENGLSADRMTVKGGVFLSTGTDGTRFEADGKDAVRLPGATIGGTLDMQGARIGGPEAERGLNAGLMTVKGSVFLRTDTDGTRFEAEGKVAVFLLGASIGGNLEMHGSKLGGTGAESGLNADGMTVKGGVFLRTATDGTRFEADGKDAVRLLGATIDGNLEMDGARLGGPKAERSLNADGLTVKGSVFLRTATDGTRFEADGKDAVRLLGATIDGNLEMDGARLGGPKAERSLNAQKLTVKGSVFLRTATGGTRFEAQGKNAVSLLGADIEGALDMLGARLGGPEAENGLAAERMTVKGDVYLSTDPDGTHFEAGGKMAVGLRGASITGQLSLVGATFTTKQGTWLDLSDSRISGPFIARSNSFLGKDGLIDLDGAHIHELADQRDGWPEGQSLWLDGLVYQRFANCDYGFRKHWIGKQIPEHLGQRRNPVGGYDLRPQPFEQCASVLRAMGHPIDAGRILIEKQRRLQEKRLAELKAFDLVTDLWRAWRSSNRRADFERLVRIRRNWPAMRLFGRWLWHLILGLTTSFGFRRGLPVVWFLGLVLLGWPLYAGAHANRIMVPSHPIVLMSEAYKADEPALPDGYPEFHSLAYSFDVALPLIDLYQEPFWQPAGNTGAFSEGPAWLTGATVRFLHIVHIILGWGFASLLVAGLAGLIRQD